MRKEKIELWSNSGEMYNYFISVKFKGISAGYKKLEKLNKNQQTNQPTYQPTKKNPKKITEMCAFKIQISYFYLPQRLKRA